MAEEKIKTEPALPILESITDNPAVANYPEWLLNMPPLDILALPFDHVTHTNDIYEMSLIVLHIRKYSYDKIHFLFHVIISPILWPFFFKKPERLTKKIIFIRWLILFFCLGIFFGGIYAVTKMLQIPRIFSLLFGIGGLSILLTHTFITMDYFYRWRWAYKRIGKKKLAEYLPTKLKKKKKT